MSERTSVRRPHGNSKARLWAALAPALVVPLLGALAYFVWLPGSAYAWPLYLVTKLYALLWPLIAWRWLLGRRWPQRPLACTHARALAAGLASGLLLVVLMALALQTPLAEVLAAGVGRMRARLEAFGLQSHYWTFALLLSLLHSALEEYYWRGFAFGRALELLSAPAAHGLAAAGFAAHHVVVAGIFFGWAWGVLAGAAVAGAGLLWSLQYRRWGTLVAPWLSHVLADLGVMTVGYWLLF